MINILVRTLNISGLDAEIEKLLARHQGIEVGRVGQMANADRVVGHYFPFVSLKSGKASEKSALPRAILTNDAVRLTIAYLERDVVKYG